MFARALRIAVRLIGVLAILTLVPMVVLGIEWFLMGGLERPSLVVVPANYRGVLRIICKDPAGAAPRRVGRELVYQFPANGVLHLRVAGPFHRERVRAMFGNGVPLVVA